MPRCLRYSVILSLTFYFALLFINMGGQMVEARGNSYDKLDMLRSARDSYIDHYRRTGEQQFPKAQEIETELKQLFRKSESEIQPAVLFELATIQRLTFQFDAAVTTFEQTVKLARSLKQSDVEFDACIGLARSHAYGTSNHGAAAAAFDQAVRAAGDHPTDKQKYDMAGYNAQLNAGRGELDAALLDGLKAIHLAQNNADRYYAHLDTGDVLQKFAESCDYRKLVDASTSSDQDSYGACYRAVAAARRHYAEAGKIAQKLGWRFLQNQTTGMNNQLDMRLFLIKQKASFEDIKQSSAFQAKNIKDVVVNENFEAGASTLPDNKILAPLIDMLLPDEQTVDPRSLYLLGHKADLEGDSVAALHFFQKAAQLLRRERSSLFDIRQRGTVLENRIEIIRDLAIRLLAFDQLDDAFVAFESMRSYGLGVLSTALEHSRLTDKDRRVLANLVGMNAQLSAIQDLLVKTTIADIDSDRTEERLKKIDDLQEQIASAQKQPETRRIIERLSASQYILPNLKEFQQSVKKANIPVLLYWVTHTNVIVWLVTPDDTQVKTVFLPEVALNDKVQKISGSIRNTLASSFDATSARELHTYLIKPFVKYLRQKQFIIIPQGTLVHLPFEVLMDSQTNNFLIEDYSVSYAPNATFALNIMQKKAAPVHELLALYDPSIENDTKEISKIESLKKLKVKSVASNALSSDDIYGLFDQADNVHVLLHGMFNIQDPLQSTIRSSSMPGAQKITAADLLTVDWRNTTLAVFSSCEGARVQTRISNEFSGISWALMAGGLDHLVLSRWRVKGKSQADWMAAFYDSLLSGNSSPAIAAAAAMRTIIAKGQRNPFFWAGPQVFGK